MLLNVDYEALLRVVALNVYRVGLCMCVLAMMPKHGRTRNFR